VKKSFTEAEIFVSLKLLEEYRDVPLLLEAEGKLSHSQMKALISGIAAVMTRAKIVQPHKKISICRDSKDNMLLECCHESKATFLITGDKDLLNLTTLPFDLEILTPRKYVEEV
jgi:hypothetical protein